MSRRRHPTVGGTVVRRSAYADDALTGTRPTPSPPYARRVRSEDRRDAVDLPWLVPLAAVVLLGTWFTNADDPSRGAATGCAVLAIAGLLAALRVPRAGALLTGVAVTSFVLLDAVDGPIYLTLAAAAFLAATRVELRRWVPPVYGGAVLVGAALLVSGGEHSPIRLLAIGGVVTAGGAVGTLIRNRHIATEERARATAAEEQLRMAHDLHDGVGHGLAVIAMQAGIGLHVLDSDPAGARRALEAIRDSARESLDALRAELSTLTGDAAARRPRRGLADLTALEERVRAAGMQVTVSGSPGLVPEPVDATAYVVVQEALTNVLKHSGATSTAVAFSRADDRLCVEVVDDGTGGAVQDGGMGLPGMRQRVEELGGSFAAGPRAAGGFVVRAELPL
jgi:signal transduction histidine kinase